MKTNYSECLPAGIWYDFWTGKRIEGRCWITREADIETIPVYVRGGTILPLADPAQCTEQLSSVRLTLKVYPDIQDNAAGEIIDGQHHISLEACRKEQAISVMVPPEVADSVVELPPGFPRPEVVIKENIK